MTLNRRGFVASVGWSFLASAAARGDAPKPAAAAGAENFSDWSQVRVQFDLSPEWLHFSQFYIVSHPRPVREAIERYRRMLDANPFATVEHGMGFAAFLGQQSQDVAFPVRVQQAAAQYLGGRPDEVALTDSTTTGLALIYNGLTLTPGDEILTTTHDHYVHHEAIRLAAERNGASWRRIALYDAPEKNWALLRPTIPSFYSSEPFAAWEDGHPPQTPTRAAWVSPGGFKAYEHQWAMAEAFEFHRRIGRARIAARIAALNTQCKEALAAIPRVKVLTPRDAALSAGIICFEVQGRTPEETVQRLLERKVIASTSPYKVTHARLAPSLVNDERQVEAAVRAVYEIA